MASQKQVTCQTRPPPLETGACLDQGGSRADGWRCVIRNSQPHRLPVDTASGPAPRVREEEWMHEDVMKPDLLSEILLLGSGKVIFVALVTIVLTAFARA
jgi:hypothetical protein